MNITGDSLTDHEKRLLLLGDVVVVDELRNVAALNARQSEVNILGRWRLQRQIDALVQANNLAAEAINQARS